MRFTKIATLLSVVLALSACDMGGTTTGGSNGTNSAKPVEISLNDQELALAKGQGTTVNSNVAAQLLVRKSVLAEIKANPFTADDNKILNELKENVEMEYYLNKVAQTKVTVTDDEIRDVYDKNKDKFPEDADFTQLRPQLAQLIFRQKMDVEKVNLINSFIEKYKLNDVLKKYVPEATQVPANVPGATTTDANAPAATPATQAAPAAPAATPAPAAKTPAAATPATKPAAQPKAKN